MTKSELTQALADSKGVSYRSAEAIINVMFDSMFQELVADGRVEFRGFGSFAIKQYGSYEGRNPKTGENITVKPKKLAVFKVGKTFRDRLAGD